jgi:hypothetical protein
MSLASRMLWPPAVTARTFTNGGRTYTFAPVIDVLAADVTAATTAGLIALGQSGAVPEGTAGYGIAGAVTAPPQTPPGGWAGLVNTPYPDPNRPAASSVSAGTWYLDAALQRWVVSNGVNWVDPVSGNYV